MAAGSAVPLLAAVACAVLVFLAPAVSGELVLRILASSKTLVLKAKAKVILA